MEEYMGILRTNNLMGGNSDVRGFTVLDEKYFLIEQEMSVCLNYVGDKWIGKRVPSRRNNKSNVAGT